MKVLGISAPWSGSGKTTVSMMLASLLNDSVTFKIGPDFIDSGLLRAISNKGENIDRYLEGNAYKRLICNYEKYEYGIFEGVMGLYDSGLDFDNSTYYYFKNLRIPHILVIDVSKMAESAYRIYKGYKNKYTAGVILNNFYGEKHFNIVKRDFEKYNVKIFGAVPRDESIKINERHLGLYTFMENNNIENIKRSAEKYLNKEILEVFSDIECREREKEKISINNNKKIYVAMDKAFNFYYEYNLNLLSKLGKIEYFSPLNDDILEKPDFIYLGGGYPELYIEDLSRNRRTKESIIEAYNNNVPVYGECGGLMYMMDNIDGKKMLGIFDGSVKSRVKLTLNYTELIPSKDILFFKKGMRIFGHEFHYSLIDTEEIPLMKNLRGNGIKDGMDGLNSKNGFGMYTHIHFFRYRKFLENFFRKY
ncbi:MAG: cobyrinate a,c-diamide synthase [Thermoplasmata archaeon]